MHEKFFLVYNNYIVFVFDFAPRFLKNKNTKFVNGKAKCVIERQLDFVVVDIIICAVFAVVVDASYCCLLLILLLLLFVYVVIVCAIPIIDAVAIGIVDTNLVAVICY